MDDIATAAGVTKGSLYWHYSSKKEVILAACNYYYEEWRRNISEAMDRAETPIDKLRAATEFSVRSCLLDNANRIFTTEVIALALYDSDVRAIWAAFLDETERLFLGLTHRAVGAGEIECDDVDRAVEVMMAAMEGAKQLALFRPFLSAPGSADRLTNELMSLLGAEVTVPGRVIS